MAYSPLGLGQLIVNALRTAVTDPQLYTRVDEANARMDELTTRFDSFASKLENNDALDTEQAEELAGIRTELEDLATALSGGVMEEVEPADQDQGEDLGGETDVPAPPADA